MKICAICGKESGTVESFKMSTEARAMFAERYRDANLDEYLSQMGIRKEYLRLPAPERMKLAEKAIGGILDEVLLDALALRGSKVLPGESRFILDIAKTIEQVTFPPGVWSWINLFGDVLVLTQREAMQHEDFLADTPFKQLLVRAINRDISSLNGMYNLIRCEFIHQAAALVRMLCESVITLRYIAKDPGIRVPQFLDYYNVEVYEIAKSTLEYERSRAKPVHVEQMEAFLATLKTNYERAKPHYTHPKKNKPPRPFSNWCDTSIRQQARHCGDNLLRLYDIVYSQLSAYIHGSEFSLRHQIAYSGRHYDAGTVLVDITTIVRTILVVWEEWARLCDELLGWKLSQLLPEIVDRLARLDSEIEAASR
ncbi:DUF5677 domain-containing protein [Candidatus Binatus sp.]|jgi:hypothetical protein|uniref:DUF5677 domain-containing protein n=1 Tax=Candidatus Binatus sp. TaxID=2811406 RepID=UPI003BC1B63E